MSLALKVEFEGENRRIRIQGKDGVYSFDEIRGAVEGIFKPVLGGAGFTLFYQDEEGDEIMIGSDAEVSEAIACSGGAQLKLKAKSDKQVELKPEEEDVEAKEEAKEDEKEEEEAPERVPLSEVLGEEITSNHYFIAMREDFGKFVENIRGSIPSDFPENVRSDFEGAMEQVREPIQGFIQGLQENKEEMTVPASWKENPLIVRVTSSMKDCSEGFEARTKRWADAKASLEEMGFEESPFVQRVLIIQHDGNLKDVLNDLLMRQQQAAQVQSTFQWLSASIVQMFQDFGVSAALHSRAIANQVSVGVHSSASYVQDQVENTRAVENLQTELGRNMENLQATLAQLNKMGEQVDGNVRQGLSNAAEHSANLYQSAHKHGFNLSATSVGLLSNSIHGLNSLVLRMSELAQQSVHRDEDVLFTCDVCQMEVHKGSRFVCAQCENFSTCEACAAKDSLAHEADHVFMKISNPRQKVNAQRYLNEDCIAMLNRPQVPLRQDFVVVGEEVKEEVTEVKEEVKEEVKKEEVVDEKKSAIQMDEIEDQALVSGLKTLREMGYCEEEKNTNLILAHSYDLEAVIEALE